MSPKMQRCAEEGEATRTAQLIAGGKLLGLFLNWDARASQVAELTSAEWALIARAVDLASPSIEVIEMVLASLCRIEKSVPYILTI